MQLVGAEDSFIQTPFLLEGIIHGLGGGLIAILALSLCIRSFGFFITRSLPFLPVSISQYPFLAVYLSLPAVGVFLGFLSSWLSVRRHLMNRLDAS
jgi:cell division transport system permease protein